MYLLRATLTQVPAELCVAAIRLWVSQEIPLTLSGMCTAWNGRYRKSGLLPKSCVLINDRASSVSVRTRTAMVTASETPSMQVSHPNPVHGKVIDDRRGYLAAAVAQVTVP